MRMRMCAYILLQVWLSPWGGYGSAKDARVAAAQREGYKVTMTDAGYGFSLNDPKYAERFKEIMHSMVLRYVRNGAKRAAGPRQNKSKMKQNEALVRES